MMNWTQLLCPDRHGDAPRADRLGPERDRTPFQRDYDRLVFSSAFKRLHDKTQVFPLPENDLVHSRLTHSLEVACVGRSLGTVVGQKIVQRGGLPEWCSARDFGDIVAAACLAHDIGNPPFGHSGEDTIQSWFRGAGSAYLSQVSEAERCDLWSFEGNAQGFRILTRLQMPANPGLKLTYATLAAFTKYPRASAPLGVRFQGNSAKKHGYHQAERSFFSDVAHRVGLLPVPKTYQEGTRATSLEHWTRHPLAFLVEAADDICYAILDLEDGVRLGYVSVELAVRLLAPLSGPGTRPKSPADDEKEYVAYLRARAISTLIKEVTEVFLAHEQDILSGRFDAALTTEVPSGKLLDEIKKETRRLCYEAREVIEIELAGYEVLTHLLELFVPVALGRDEKRDRRLLKLLPIAPSGTPYERLLRVTDHLSGMTDSYAVALYRKLLGVSLATR
ncbi:MAG: dNTP triphosphohydrolase [Myxococcota bacterium]